MSATIYLKAHKQINLYNVHKITINDLADVYGDPKVVNRIKTLKVANIIQPDKKHRMVISILDILKVIDQEFPTVTVNSVGEMDTLIEYCPNAPVANKLFTAVKVIVVCLILFCGSGVAIMTFQADASVPTVFANIHEIITGKYIERPLWLLIPYSVGLFMGVTVFFNHLFKKKLTEDPTPIQIEMYKYDKEVNECLIKVVNDEEKAKKQLKNKEKDSNDVL